MNTDGPFLTFESGFFDLSKVKYNTKISKMVDRMKYVAQIAIFTPFIDPLCRINFLVSTILFLGWFQLKKDIKKGPKYRSA